MLLCVCLLHYVFLKFTHVVACCSSCFLIFIYFPFLFWLRRVLVAAHRIFVEACEIFRCGAQSLHCGVRASLLLWRVCFLSLVVARRL